MNKTGLLAVIAGVWIIAQVTVGGAVGRLGLLGEK